MSQTLTEIPQQLRVGDTWAWKKTLTNYPASQGWALTYTLINSANKISVSSSADGDFHAVSVLAATTAAYAAGDYRWYAYATKTTERYSVGEGEIELLPNPADASVATLDTRTTAEKNLERIDALIAANTDASYSIGSPDGGSRSKNRHDLGELERQRTYWQTRRNIEIRRERAARGLGHRGNVKVYIK